MIVVKGRDGILFDPEHIYVEEVDERLPNLVNIIAENSDYTTELYYKVPKNQVSSLMEDIYRQIQFFVQMNRLSL